MTSVFTAALHCLQASSLDDKIDTTHSAAAAWRQGELLLEDDGSTAITAPGRPTLPELISPRDLPRRKLGDPVGHACLIHAIAHIEFNAIDLGWDAVHRFRDMPRDYYGDWIRVADEEARHFTLLRNHLKTLGYDYGDFPAHNGLWDMAQRTASDPLVRMALVPRVLEARGLDVTPGMMKRLRDIGDSRAVEILDVIWHDEVGHVEIGTRWFRYLCQQRGLEPDSTFAGLIKEYIPERVRGPFDHAMRKQAGFSEWEIDFLEEYEG
jgi:uncharacterized ferritin-like protein (DUF455 family)